MKRLAPLRYAPSWIAIAARAAVAGEPSAGGEQDPAALLREGVALRKEHRDEEALRSFQRANALRPNAVARAQIALAEQALARWVEAEVDLSTALDDPNDDPWMAKNRDALGQMRAAIRAHLTALTVDVNVPSAVVRFGEWSLVPSVERWIPAGDGTLETNAAGYLPDVRPLSLTPGAHLKVVLALVAAALPEPVAETPLPVSALPPAPPEVRGASSRAAIWGPLTLGAAGIVGLGVGAYFGVRTLDSKGDMNARCEPVCTTAAQTAYADARFSAAVSDVALGTGVALLAGGAAWWLLARGPVTLAPGPAVAGASVRARW